MSDISVCRSTTSDFHLGVFPSKWFHWFIGPFWTLDINMFGILLMDNNSLCLSWFNLVLVFIFFYILVIFLEENLDPCQLGRRKPNIKFILQNKTIINVTLWLKVSGESVSFLLFLFNNFFIHFPVRCKYTKYKKEDFSFLQKRMI